MADEDSSAYLTAMTTEHFVLQSAAAVSATEASSRASIYLAAMSGALVTLGFTAGNPKVFPYIAGGLIPAVFVLGLFTVVRLVDTTIDNLGYQARMRRVYEYYATLAPGGRHNFPTGIAARNEAQTTFRSRHRFPLLTTTATTIGAVNGVIGGAAVAYVLVVAAGRPVPAAVVLGIAAALLVTVGTVIYQRRRFISARAYPED